MIDTIFPTILAAVVLLGAIAWAFVSRRERVEPRRLWLVVATGIAIIALLVLIRTALPETPQAWAVAVVGIALSGVLVWVAMRYGQQLPQGQRRQLVAAAILGAILTILGLLFDLDLLGR